MESITEQLQQQTRRIAPHDAIELTAREDVLFQAIARNIGK